MLLGAATTIVLLTLAIVSPPRFLLPPTLFAQSIERALAWDVFVILCLLAHIGSLACHRFLTPADIDGSGPTPGTERAQALQGLLQNTLEQVVLAVPTHLAWAALMPRNWQAAIPAAVVLFVSGRVLFWWGYMRGAPARALGFALTFYPTAAMLLLLLLRVVVGEPV